jgi:DNA-binding NtrC family response regulator
MSGGPAQHESPKLDAPGAEPRTPRPIAGHGERILYIDDDEALVALVSRLMVRNGYRLSGHADPRGALDALRAEPHAFALVVSDENLPGTSGVQIAEEARRIAPEVRVAIVSGLITDDLATRARAAGIEELISKPNLVQDLCEVVGRLIHPP